jgi:retinol dehydrogenase-12
VYLHLDLADLTTIKASAQEFLKREKRLDVLWNNAGVMVPPQGSKTKQGYELMLGTNNVAPFLFTQLLTPLLIETARTAPKGSVRVVWVASGAAEHFSPPGGVDMENLGYEKEDKSAWFKYGQSKAGNILHGSEYGKRYGGQGILSVVSLSNISFCLIRLLMCIVKQSLDPGNLKTDLYQTVPWWQMAFLNRVLKKPIFGAYTELYGGLSEEIKMKNNGTFGKSLNTNYMYDAHD